MAEFVVRSEIAGVVRKIEVAPGDTVAPEGELLILESMKMEIPVLVPQGGKVRTILVQEGATVAEGETLAILEH